MKRYPYIRSTTRQLLCLALAAGLALPLPSLAAAVALATSPLATSTTSSVLPNLMFILDDSGSMDWTYMPDNANDFNGAYGYASSQCNGVYYDPATTYTPPVTSTGTSYANATFTGAWDDGYNTGAGTTNLNTGFRPSTSYTATDAFYYKYLTATTTPTGTGAQTTAYQQNFYNTSGTFYQECNSNIGSTPGSSVFSKRRLATTETTTITVTASSAPTATITVTGGSSTVVSSIVVNGTTITSGASTGSTNNNTEANNIAAKINVGGSGYTASASSNVVTITGPSGAATFTPVINITSGSDTLAVTAFNNPSVSSITVNGVELMGGTSVNCTTNTSCTAGNIAAKIWLNGFSATSSGNVVTITGPTSAADYTPVITSSGLTLTTDVFPDTTAAKLQNFANWYSYYRTRMLMMKTSTGLAFKTIDDKYRVGFMTINNNVSPDILNIAPFDATQKSNWYAKLYAAVPDNSTPLREALAHAGRIYAHKITSLYGATITDPVQYSCQQNFTILSTDGFWNGNDGFKLDGSTAVGNQDGTAERPMYDGGLFNKTTSQVRETQTQVAASTSQLQKKTTQIQSRSSHLRSQTSQLQTRTSTLQTRTGTSTGNPLQRRDSHDSGATYGAWYDVSSCTVDNSGTNRNECQGGLERSDSTNSGASYGAWYSVSSCTVDNSGTNRNMCRSPEEERTSSNSGATWTAWYPVQVGSCSVDNFGSNRTECQSSTSWSAWADAASCTSSSTTECQYTSSAWVGTSSCTPVSPSSSSPYTVATATECQTAVTTPYANAASCTVNATPDGSGHTTQCQYSAYSAWANASSCSTVAQSGGSPYTVDIATDCQTTDTGWVGASSCTASGPTGGQTITCQGPITTGPTPVASCTAATAASGNSWTSTSCTTSIISPSTVVASCTPAAASASNGYVTTTCATTTLSTTNNTSSCVPGNSGAPNYIQTSCAAGAGGTSDTLADVAMYYYQTDLRTSALDNCTGVLGSDVCENNVPVTSTDNNVNQHMTTFTLGLGARGRMVYTSYQYMTDTSGDFYSVLKGSTADSSPTPPVCSWQANGTTCNWPVPSSDQIENIDDLWHAAVNGRGTYFSATNPTTLSEGLTQALNSIKARKGAAAAAATSTLNPVDGGNNFAYVASYTTVTWKGNLESRNIDFHNGVISEDATWCVDNLSSGTCASPGSIVADSSGSGTTYNCVTPSSTIDTCPSPGVLVGTDCKVPMATSCTGTLPAKVGPSSDTRIIKTANSGGTALVDFTYANLTAAQQAYFAAAHINTLSQWSSLTAAQQTAAEGVNLVNYLRGQNQYEMRESNIAANHLYRYREAVLGDALESQPAYLSKPVFNYADAGYSDFKATQTAIAAVAAGTVYIGTNDGMLHAFAADTGIERWAYVPSMVIPNLWKLADSNYSIKHTNFVNGSPVMSDVYDSATAQWRTILVGGLSGGGRGYYALDITDPTTPALLWEFTPTQDANVGYSFGNPIITKKEDGTWVVLVTSGYDNGTLSGDAATSNSPAGDGKGYLYVLNAMTGSKISAITTNVGDSTTPSGLAKIAAWNNASAGTGNMAGYVYGGDLRGNVWRFDINTAAAPLQFAILKDPSNNTQPITTAPVLGEIGGKRIVFIGTGKYLETSDLTNTQVQSQYAIKDDDATTTLTNPGGSPRNSTTLVQQTITTSDTNDAERVATNNTVNFSTGRGWYIDFPDSGERVNIDSKLILGTLIVPTIVPSNTACSPGGIGWLNYFNYETGSAVVDIVSQKYDSPIVGVNVIYIEGSPIVEVVTASDPTPKKPTKDLDFTAPGGSFTSTRVIWRELIP